MGYLLFKDLKTGWEKNIVYVEKMKKSCPYFKKKFHKISFSDMFFF